MLSAEPTLRLLDVSDARPASTGPDTRPERAVHSGLSKVLRALLFSEYIVPNDGTGESLEGFRVVASAECNAEGWSGTERRLNRASDSALAATPSCCELDPGPASTNIWFPIAEKRELRLRLGCKLVSLLVDSKLVNLVSFSVAKLSSATVAERCLASAWNRASLSRWRMPSARAA